MHKQKIELVNKKIRFVTNLSIAGNIVLSAVKVGVGLFAGSMALVADGIHSLSDMVTDIAVLVGVYFGSKQPDESHPYGHGRIETFAAAFIGTALGGGGAAMIYCAAVAIAAGKYRSLGFIVLFVALISIVVKELLYIITRRVAVQSHSPSLYANAGHHRSDALSSVAVVIGFVSLRLGFKYGDQMAAVGVGLMVVLVGARIMGDCLRELAEAAVDADTIERIKQIINTEPSVHQWHKLRTRTVGREVFLDLHILVDPDLSIATAHEIAEGLESALHEQIARPVNITVHIEPDIAALRK